LIDEIYQREKRLERKHHEREDFVASQDLIFDLTKKNRFDQRMAKHEEENKPEI
jgi:hypothetical protein